MAEDNNRFRQAYKDALRDMEEEYPEVVLPAATPALIQPYEERVRLELYRRRAPNAEKLRVLRVYDPHRKYNTDEQNLGFVFIQPRDPALAQACNWPNGIERLLHLNSEKDIAYCASPDGKVVELRYLGKVESLEEVDKDAVLAN